MLLTKSFNAECKHTIDFLHNHITLGIETKNLLDTLRQPPYHETEAIYLSSQSLQWINDKKLNVFGVNHAEFLHYVHLMSL
ncbi:hypothetical protein [Wolbachia endosymbiont (group A) of Yponomeuta plumbellus]|uniref:hypothetical protein n=1 Tax=Wolbachia endosymbiont (group A) of Yponomeuta plumbellus TaxID=2954068 RepID=UPI00222F1594|nr:hypothetical protein [Wolbachia endosymbiont (group A) of Yponomeuta plumbellus]